MSSPYRQGTQECVYFHDEMRSGTRTALKRRWTPQGHRPISSVNIGYKYVYLYAAVNPYNGDLIALLLPSMTTECFAAFMRHFDQQTMQKYGANPVLLILDGATNHQQRVLETDRIVIEKLPRACPELNPAERFFEQLRTELSNQVFENIEDVEIFLCDILHKYFEQPKVVQSLTSFPYIRRR